MDIKKLIDKIQRTKMKKISAEGCHQASIVYRNIFYKYIELINKAVRESEADLVTELYIEGQLKLLVEMVRFEALSELREKLLLNPLETVDNVINFNFKFK